MEKVKVKRRLAAILAADVVGYSRLVSRDEEGTLARLKALREELIDPSIARHEGRIFKTTGDGMLAEFPSVVDALRDAVEVQVSMARRNAGLPEDQRLVFRVGVNLGDIVADGDDILGDGVNVAARLEAIAEPGGICVSRTVFNHVKDKVAFCFEDMGSHKLKNIAEPLQVYRVLAEAPAAPVTRASEIAGRPSIAVLPFSNISGDAEQDYFSDGITEDIITALAAWRLFPVIARNSTFAYKGQSPDVRQVANDLGARYVLEGSVRKAGNQVRITGQLIDGATGNHVWAERYDRSLDDIFAVQDEITAKIVAAVEPEMSKAETSVVIQRRPESLNSWELYLRAMAMMPTYGKHRQETKRLFERAIEADGSFADAYAALALCHSADVYARRAGDTDAAIARMLDLVKRAMELDPRNFRVHQVLCMAHFWLGDLKQAVEAGRRAVELNPSSAEAQEVLAAALSNYGQPEEAEASARMCLALSPVDPRLHNYHFQLMQALLGQGRFELSYETLAQCLFARPHDVVYLGFKTVLLGHLGRDEEAKACLAEYLGKREFKTVDDYRKAFVPNSALLEINLEGLRKAGWAV